MSCKIVINFQIVLERIQEHIINWFQILKELKDQVVACIESTIS